VAVKRFQNDIFPVDRHLLLFAALLYIQKPRSDPILTLRGGKCYIFGSALLLIRSKLWVIWG